MTDVASPPAMSRRQIMITFSGLLLSMLLASLDQTIVGTALPTIAGDLGGLQNLSWVVTVYLLATTASTPLWGSFGDSYGRKRLLMIAIVIFLVGSALCGLAWNLTSLVTFRGLQGIGAGGLMVMSMSVVGDIIAPRERGRYQGYIQAVFAFASIVGPLVGGVFVDTASWRWVFYVNLPLGALALLVIGATLRPTSTRRPHQVDYFGAALLVLSVSTLLLAVAWGGRTYAWSSGEVKSMLVVHVISTVGFVLRERAAKEPLLSLPMLANPVVAVVALVLFTISACFFAAIVYLPTYLQVVLGQGATSSGLQLLPMLLSIMAASTVSGWLMSRTGRYKIFPVTGTALVALAMGLFSLLGTSTAWWVVSLDMVVMGLGFGLITQILVVAVQNAVGKRQIGAATASTSFFRSLGGSLGLALFGTIFGARLNAELSASGVGTGNVQTDPTRFNPAQIRALDPAVSHVIESAFAQSLHHVFYAGLGIAVVSVIAVQFLKEVPLRRQGPPAGGPNKSAAEVAGSDGSGAPELVGASSSGERPARSGQQAAEA